jgi:hypothetical protein
MSGCPKLFNQSLRQPAERAGAVADEWHAHVHAFEERLPEVSDGRLLCHVPENALNICLGKPLELFLRGMLFSVR